MHFEMELLPLMGTIDVKCRMGSYLLPMLQVRKKNDKMGQRFVEFLTENLRWVINNLILTFFFSKRINFIWRNRLL